MLLELLGLELPLPCCISQSNCIPNLTDVAEAIGFSVLGFSPAFTAAWSHMSLDLCIRMTVRLLYETKDRRFECAWGSSYPFLVCNRMCSQSWEDLILCACTQALDAPLDA